MNNEQTWAVLAHVNSDGTGHLDTGVEHHEICEPTTHEAMVALVTLAKRMANEQAINILLGGTAPDAPRVGLLITADGQVSEDPRGLLHRTPRPPLPHSPPKPKQRGRKTSQPQPVTTSTPAATTEAAPIGLAEKSDASGLAGLSVFDDDDGSSEATTAPAPAAKAAFPWRTGAGVLVAAVCLGTAFAAAGRTDPPSATTSSELKHRPSPTVVTVAPVPVTLRVRTDVDEKGTVTITVRGEVDTAMLTLRRSNARGQKRSVALTNGVGNTRLSLAPGAWTYVAKAPGAQAVRGRIVVHRPQQGPTAPAPVPAPPVPAPPATSTPQTPATPPPKPPPAPPPAPRPAPPKAPKDPQDSPPPAPIG